MRILLALLFFSISLSAGLAVEPNEIMDDPALEQRAREVSKGLRCVVCQNQSIDDSNSDLARDMRVLVRERILAGDSNQQVTDYMVSRYGDFVLLKPPLKKSTYVLWFGPLLIVGFGIFIVMIFYRRRSNFAVDTLETPPAALSDEESHRLDVLLKDDK